jgi:hypothetical protein
MEEMRIDPAHTWGPLRINAWVSIAVFVISVTMVVVLGRRAKSEGDPSELTPAGDTTAS